ncbi:MAG TPA: hypothetical protein VGK19_20000 [Capsulimonadaceae bacterium]|jgi:hypothetical protein
MKNFPALTVLFGALVLLPALHGRAETASTPSLVIAAPPEEKAATPEPAVFDLGTISLSDTKLRAHTFIIQNNGTLPITIRLGQKLNHAYDAWFDNFRASGDHDTDSKRSGYFSMSAVHGSTVEAGGATQLHTVVDPRMLFGHPYDLPLNITDVSGTALVTLHIKATSRPLFVSVPDRIDFGVVNPDRPVAVPVTVTFDPAVFDRSQQPSPTFFGMDAGVINAVLASSTGIPPDPIVQKYIFTVAKRAPLGPISGQVAYSIGTNLGLGQYLLDAKLPVTGNVVGDASLSPSYLDVSGQAIGTVVEKTVKLTVPSASYLAWAFASSRSPGTIVAKIHKPDGTLVTTGDPYIPVTATVASAVRSVGAPVTANIDVSVTVPTHSEVGESSVYFFLANGEQIRLPIVFSTSQPR